MISSEQTPAFDGSSELAASFRDPSGSLVSIDGRILRLVNAAGLADLDAFLASDAGKKSMENGRVVRTARLPETERRRLQANPAVRELSEEISAEAVLEHERVPFPSFPYEWPPEMLHAAAVLTLELGRDLLRDNLGLKDGTPYNILFRGPEPVFIDLLSFERRDPRDPTWLPYAQFVRTFVLPLVAAKSFGLPIDQILTVRRDGLEPEDVYRWLGSLQKLRPPFLSLVSLPTWLAGRRKQDDQSIYQKRLVDSPEKARFILEHLLKGLGRTLRKVAPTSGKSSTWSDYMSGNNNYTNQHFEAKEKFVCDALAEFSPRRVLDVGCNTGHFSRLAARAGAGVVALDYDPVVVGEVWRNARSEKLDILPLVVNLTRPTPGMGWLNRECSSFLDRARGSFDAVFFLAVIHHMLVTERVPLPAILKLASELTRDLAVIEFVDPEDSMFRRLTHGREELHKNLNSEVFERQCGRYFRIVRRQHLEGTRRWLYLLRKGDRS